MKTRFLIALPLLALGCGEPGGPDGGSPRAAGGEPIAADEFARLEASAVAGQTVYVSAYSNVYSSDEGRPFHLATTLSIHNTDPERPIALASVRYFDSDGKPVRAYLELPVRLGPLASAEFFVPEADTAGGFGASFLVEWLAEAAVSPPSVEAVMIGTARTQGISFVCEGRVVRDRSG